jgi:uncharacterized membrane protein
MLKGVYKHLKNTQVFRKYPEKVSETNADALGIFITFGLISSLLAVIMELALLKTRDFWCVVVLVGYFLILEFYYRKNIEQHVDYSTLFLYLAQIPVILLAVFMGSWLNQAEKAFTILIMMVSFPTFILDKPRRVLL